jgi:hypothetical protein
MNIGKGKVGDVISYLRDARRCHLQRRPKLSQDRARVRVVDYLSDDADSAEPRCLVVGRQSKYRADDLAKPAVHRPNRFVNDARQCGRRMREFVSHQTEAQVGAIGSAHLFEHRANGLSQNFFGLCVVVERLSNGFILHSAYGLPQDFGIQAELVAKMIIHCSDIRARASAYLADSRVVVAALGKDFACRFKHLGARPIDNDARRYGL